VVILFSLSSIAQTLYRAYTSPLRKIPGPWYARISHIGLKWHVLRGRRIHYIHELHARYGPIVQIAPNEVAVSDLDAFGEIHRIGSGYLKSPWYQQFSPSESPGIFVMIDPKAHAVRRKLFAQAFSKSYLRQNWETVIRSKAEIAVAKIKRDAQNGGVDILKWWTFLATDVIGHLSFGGSFRMLEQEEVSSVFSCSSTHSMNAG
jgi:cytochrome P450